MQSILIYGVAIIVSRSDDAGEEVQFTEERNLPELPGKESPVWVADQNESHRNDGK